MNELRDGIAQLAAAVTDRERALALLSCLLSLLMTCEFTIRNRLMHAGFREGLSYLDAELACLRAFRDEAGEEAHRMARAAARGRMQRISAGLDPSGQGEA